MNIYLTQDRIGSANSGGSVTYHEYRALESLGSTMSDGGVDRVKTLPVDSGIVQGSPDPLESDARYAAALSGKEVPMLAHVYAGCFSRTISMLRRGGAKVSYTAAAHDIEASKQEYESLGIPFNYPHLTVPELWTRYISGYKEADLVICPSRSSAAVMRSYGCTNVTVIPHGCTIPATVHPLPKTFTVGYLGQAGPDKGLRYLFEAWKKLNFKNATLLIAGNNIDQALPLWRKFGGGNVEFMGFVKDVSDFYNRISLYVQPSVTEGFGMEVLEAMTHARPVVCSKGAGAVDLLADGGVGYQAMARDVDGLANGIARFQEIPEAMVANGESSRKTANAYTWQNIMYRYHKAWASLFKNSINLSGIIQHHSEWRS